MSLARRGCRPARRRTWWVETFLSLRGNNTPPLPRLFKTWFSSRLPSSLMNGEKKMSHSDTQGELPAPLNETQKDSWLPSVSVKHQHADHRVPLQNIKYTLGWFSCDQTESFLGQDHTRHPVNFTIKDYARASDRTTHHSSTKTHLS